MMSASAKVKELSNADVQATPLSNAHPRTDDEAAIPEAGPPAATILFKDGMKPPFVHTISLKLGRAQRHSGAPSSFHPLEFGENTPNFTRLGP